MTNTQPDAGDPTGDRIAKLLARAGVASRREIERMIEEGRIAIDGVVLTTPATILASLDGVTVDGKPVAAAEPARLFLYHKPPGLLVTERDPAGRLTIYDRLPRDLPRLVPVGRLDLATEGLLLLTTDGGLKRTLELPATGVERTYRARAYGDITQARLEDLIDGIEIEGIRYGSIDANLERRTGANGWIEMTLTEGKNREVRRVLEFLGLQVSRLIRTRYGPFVLGDLQPGELGEARGADIATFRRSLESPRRKGQDQTIVEVAARAPKPPPAPAAAPERPMARTAEPMRGPRGEKPAAGWGSRTRPSRPAAVEPDAARSRGRIAPPRERSEVERPAREDRVTAATRRAEGGRFSRDRGEALGSRVAPGRRSDGERPARSNRPKTDSRTPEGSTGRAFRDRSAAPGRRGENDRPMRSDRAPMDSRRPDGGGGRFARDRGDAATAKPVRSRTSSDPRGPRPERPTGGKPAGKGPAGGRGHPPRPPKGGAPRGGKR